MNPVHKWLSSSRIWRDIVQAHIVPWALDGVKLEGKTLELGPGSGFTTASLLALSPDLTCIEIDSGYATGLVRSAAGKGVRVLSGDAAALPLANASFDSIVCFAMLHHVPSTVLQDRVLGEVMRALRPGGSFIGADLLPTPIFRLFHIAENVQPVDPRTLPARLRAAGFEGIQIDVRRRDFRFRARK